MADFASIEASDGLRLSWNVWPNSRIEATKCVVPFGALYTPIKALSHVPVTAANTLLLPETQYACVVILHQ